MQEFTDRLQLLVGINYNKKTAKHEYRIEKWERTLVVAQKTQIVIGETAEFYERTMQSNVDFRDIMVFNINELATICDNLQKNLKGVVEKHYVTFWQFDSHMLRAAIEGYEIRDVKKERGDELDKAMAEEDNEDNE